MFLNMNQNSGEGPSNYLQFWEMILNEVKFTDSEQQLLKKLQAAQMALLNASLSNRSGQNKKPKSKAKTLTEQQSLPSGNPPLTKKHHLACFIKCKEDKCIVVLLLYGWNLQGK